MAKVKFNTYVKFKGKFIEAHQSFIVPDDEFEELVSGGAIVVESPVPKVEPVVEKAPVQEKPKKAPAPKSKATTKK